MGGDAVGAKMDGIHVALKSPSIASNTAVMACFLSTWFVCSRIPLRTEYQSVARGRGGFRYLVAGRYTGGGVPDGMALHEFPAGEWALFDCHGPIPGALQERGSQSPFFRMFSGRNFMTWRMVENREKQAHFP